MITIARAFLADPALPILAEATRSVDSRTKRLEQHAMAALHRSQFEAALAPL